MIAERKNKAKLNNSDLSRYLQNYKASFSKPIDEVWDQADLDKNGYLDKDEAK